MSTFAGPSEPYGRPVLASDGLPRSRRRRRSTPGRTRWCRRRSAAPWLADLLRGRRAARARRLRAHDPDPDRPGHRPDRIPARCRPGHAAGAAADRGVPLARQVRARACRAIWSSRSSGAPRWPRWSRSRSTGRRASCSSRPGPGDRPIGTAVFVAPPVEEAAKGVGDRHPRAPPPDRRDRRRHRVRRALRGRLRVHREHPLHRTASTPTRPRSSAPAAACSARSSRSSSAAWSRRSRTRCSRCRSASRSASPCASTGRCPQIVHPAARLRRRRDAARAVERHRRPRGGAGGGDPERVRRRSASRARLRADHGADVRRRRSGSRSGSAGARAGC